MSTKKLGWMANVFIHSGKAYLPVLGWTDAGMYHEYGPVLTCDADNAALATTLKELKALGNPPMPHPSHEVLDKASPVEKAMRIRGFKKMAREGVIVAVISQLEESWRVAFSPADATDVQLIDYDQASKLPPDVGLEAIAKYILEELGSRLN